MLKHGGDVILCCFMFYVLFMFFFLCDNVLILTHASMVVSNNSPLRVHWFTFNCPLFLILNNGQLKVKEWTFKGELLDTSK